MNDLRINSNYEPIRRLRLTSENINKWPFFYKLLVDGKIRFDSNGRLRYLHGAPVGDLILSRVGKNGTLAYKESTEEWFDPESQKAKEFIWP